MTPITPITPITPGDPSDRPRILIVDDDALVRRIYLSKFSAEGFDVATAESGERALRELDGLRADVVLLDLMLPGIGGAAVIKAIRARAETRELPVVVFSNAYLDEEVHAARDAGASLVLGKSNHGPRQVVDAVRGVLVARTAPREWRLPLMAPVTPAASASESTAVSTARRRRSVSQLPANAFAERAGELLRSIADRHTALTSSRHDGLGLLELAHRLRSLAGIAAIAGHRTMACLAEATESLTRQVAEQPRCHTTSTLRTIGQAVACLHRLTGTHAVGDLPADAAALVVDDDQLVRALVKAALGKVGLATVPAGDAATALRLAAERNFAIVLSDVMMLGMNGLQFAARVRALPGYQATPIIFVTGLVDLPTFSDPAGSQASDVIAKPFLALELATKALAHLLRTGGRQVVDPWANVN